MCQPIKTLPYSCYPAVTVLKTILYVNFRNFTLPQASFIPSADARDTSYFMSRYIWNLEEENVHGGSDFDDMETGSASCSSSSYSNLQDEDVSLCCRTCSIILKKHELVRILTSLEILGIYG